VTMIVMMIDCVVTMMVMMIEIVMTVVMEIINSADCDCLQW